MRIFHVTTIHKEFDNRIFRKYCLNAPKNVQSVFLLSPHRHKNQASVRSLRLCYHRNLCIRVLINYFLIISYILKFRPDIVQFHDLELLPLSKFLSYFTVTVFDMHENIFLKFKSLFYSRCLAFFVKNQNVIFAEKSYSKYFDREALNSIDFLNFPLRNDMPVFHETGESKKAFGLKLCYVGVISESRCIPELLDAYMKLYELDRSIGFDLIGPCANKTLLTRIKVVESETALTYHSRVPANVAYRFINNSDICLCLLKPTPNYYESFPTKIYEYILFRKPFITSDFPVIKEGLLDFGFPSEFFLEDDRFVYESLLYMISNIDAFRNVDGLKNDASSLLFWDEYLPILESYYENICR